jgi:hypothetical protein
MTFAVRERDLASATSRIMRNGLLARFEHPAAAMHIRFRRSFEAQDVCTEVVALRIVATDSCDSRSNSAPTNPFLRHPQKKYLTADAATSLTR